MRIDVKACKLVFQEVLMKKEPSCWSLIIEQLENSWKLKIFAMLVVNRKTDGWMSWVQLTVSTWLWLNLTFWVWISERSLLEVEELFGLHNFSAVQMVLCEECQLSQPYLVLLRLKLLIYRANSCVGNLKPSLNHTKHVKSFSLVLNHAKAGPTHALIKPFGCHDHQQKPLPRTHSINIAQTLYSAFTPF